MGSISIGGRFSTIVLLKNRILVHYTNSTVQSRNKHLVQHIWMAKWCHVLCKHTAEQGSPLSEFIWRQSIDFTTEQKEMFALAILSFQHMTYCPHSRDYGETAHHGRSPQIAKPLISWPEVKKRVKTSAVQQSSKSMLQSPKDSHQAPPPLSSIALG